MSASQRPQKKYLDIAIKYSRYEKNTMLLSMFTTLLTLLINDKIPNEIRSIPAILSIVFILLIFFFNTICEQNLFKADNERRFDAFDNAYGTSSAEHNSKDYFDVDDFPLGDEKLLAQLHENCMFTKNISKKMFYKSIIMNIIICMLLVIGVFIGVISAQIFSVVLLVYVSKIYLVDLFSIYQISRCTEELEKEIKTLWDLYDPNKLFVFRSKVISLYVRYESMISHYKVILDGDIYAQVNPKLTNDWNDIAKGILNKIK